MKFQRSLLPHLQSLSSPRQA
jgi:hypothetical protein